MKTFARTECRAEIARRFGTLRPDSAPKWGRMSAHQMICHMSDACRIATGRKQVLPVGGWPQRTLVKWIALYLPVPWPRGVPTVPEIDQFMSGTKPDHFAADVAQLLGLLDGIPAPGAGAAWPAHPIFGRMSEAAWLRWAYLHADHHLRQFGA